jgi:hypothetical protein
MDDASPAELYNTHGHNLHFPPSTKVQVVTECGIASSPQKGKTQK